MSRKFRPTRKIRKGGLPPGTLIYTGSRKEAPANVVQLQFDEHQCLETDGYTGNNPLGYTWIDVRSLSDIPVIENIGREFHIHPLALEDVLNTHQRGKLDEYDNGLFFIVPNLQMNADTNAFVSEQISIFAGKHFVISFQEDPDDTLEPVRKRAKDGLSRIRKKGTDYLLYALVDTIIDGYYTVLDTLEGNILELEDTLHVGGTHQGTKAKMFELKRVANAFKHRVLPLREAANRLYRTESPLIDEANRVYFRDLVDHVAQILDGIDNHRDMLSNMEALYHAEAANRLNNVMRLLTVISTIFIPLSFIAGVYGMNFDNMPELHTTNGYFVLLGVMFCMLVGMLAYFRVKKWI
jgi:magnesium transporter